jgi:hypothetical protein
MSGGEWNTSRERKQLAADARELEREQIRLAKRMLRDLRWSAERSRLRSRIGLISSPFITSTARRAPCSYGRS